jgi:hypothetical protein
VLSEEDEEALDELWRLRGEAVHEWAPHWDFRNPKKSGADEKRLWAEVLRIDIAINAFKRLRE